MPSFWLPTIAPPGTPRDLARKLVRPLAPADPFGVLPFAWFGRACRNGEHEPGALGELGELISDEVAQALYVNLNQGERDLNRAAVVALLSFISAGGAGLAFGAAGFAVGAAVSWAAFGGDLASLLRLVSSEDAQLKSAAEQVGRLPWVPVTTRSQLLVRRLERLAHLQIPAILALEDAHLAARPPLRSVGPSWPQRLHTSLSSLPPNPRRSSPRWSTVKASARSCRRQVARVRPRRCMSRLRQKPRLEQITHDVLPQTDWATRRSVVRASGGSIEAAVLHAARVAVGLTPTPSTEALIQTRWDGFGVDLQLYLASMAALQGEVWYADQPLDNLAVLPRSTQEACQFRALADGLLVAIDRWRLAFSERELYFLARARAPDLIPSDQLSACRWDLFESITVDKADSEVWDPLPLPVKATVLRTHCGLYSELEGDGPSLAAAVLPHASDHELENVLDELIDSEDRLAGAAASGDELIEATRAAARAVDLVGLARRRGGFIEAQRAVQIQARYAYLPVAGRDLADLFDEAASFTADMQTEHGIGGAEHLTARWNEACLHAAVYDFARSSATLVPTPSLALQKTSTYVLRLAGGTFRRTGLV